MRKATSNIIMVTLAIVSIIAIAPITMSAYGQITEEKANEGVIAAMKTTQLIDQATGITNMCIMMLKIDPEEHIDKCLTFIKDYGQAMQGVIDRYNTQSYPTE